MQKRFVIGDIHGCVRTFRILLEEKIQPTKNDLIYLLGDYIDRGPNSKSVVDYIMELKQNSFQVISLMGNHEYMLNHAQTSVSFFNLWMINSGHTTLRDFGILVESYYSPRSMLQIPEKYLEFFRNLSIYEQTEDYFFCHGCLNGESVHPLEDIESLIWGRKAVYNEGFLQGRVLVHGHTPVSYSDIQITVNDSNSKIVNLDGGCVYKNTKSLGNLVALELDSRELYCVKNSE